MEGKKSFEVEVIERLTVLETLIKNQDYKSIKKDAEDANHRSMDNEKRIGKIEDKITWIVRLVLGAIVLGVLAFIFKI